MNSSIQTEFKAEAKYSNICSGTYVGKIEIINDKNILISAHGNSIRALCKYLFDLDNDVISKLEIPTGNPLLIEVNGDKKVLSAKYLDSDRAKDLLVF